jgi:hypothetical protein
MRTWRARHVALTRGASAMRFDDQRVTADGLSPQADGPHVIF